MERREGERKGGEGEGRRWMGKKREGGSGGLWVQGDERGERGFFAENPLPLGREGFIWAFPFQGKGILCKR